MLVAPSPSDLDIISLIIRGLLMGAIGLVFYFIKVIMRRFVVIEEKVAKMTDYMEYNTKQIDQQLKDIREAQAGLKTDLRQLLDIVLTRSGSAETVKHVYRSDPRE